MRRLHPWAGIALLLALPACPSGGAGERGFEDDGTGDHARPPDLPAPGCDPKREGQCPEGQKCSYVVDPELGPTNRCVELIGEGLDGDSCERIGETDDCGDGRICWGTLDDGSDGVCVPFCDPQLGCADDTQVCSVANDGLLPLCLQACDPLAQNCAEDWACYPDSNKRWACDRDRSGELGAHGDPCDCLNCCDPGLACMYAALVDGEGCGEGEVAGCCAQLCTVLPEEPPPEGQCPSELEDCEPFYEPEEKLEGYENVGVCRL